MSTAISLSAIRLDGGTQPRAGIDFEAVYDYADEMLGGASFPPVVVFYDGTSYWLADGFHRFKAAERSGADQIACEVHQGTQQDAQWYSFSANKTNGLRRTNEDKQRAVKAALLHPTSRSLSDFQIAKHIGVAQTTVSNWRRQMEATQQIAKSPSRTGADGRTINTDSIGKHDNGPASGSATVPPLSAAEPAALDLAPNVVPAPIPTSAPTPIPSPPFRTLTQVTTSINPYEEWRTRIMRACTEIANCPVTAKQLATTIAETNSEFFNHLEKAHEILANVLDARQ